MTPTILIAGATGNTGRGVVATLSHLHTTSHPLISTHRIIALTRSATSPTAQHLASLPGIEIIEKNWVDITPSWFLAQNVTRAFIASHSQPNQFAEESTFLVAALRAGVEYVVRISTMAPNVRADCPAFYPRSHWAIEALLSSPEFERMAWTSLQANLFSGFYLASAAAFIKEFRATGTQPGKLRLMASREAGVGAVDANEVGVFAAHLLGEADPAVHNGAKYVVNGPEDITGEQIVRLVEGRIGAKVEEENVVYKDLSFVDQLVAAAPHESASVISSMVYGAEAAWEGKCSASTTSKEVLELAPPRRTPAQVLKDMVGE
ncbi:hypothetical protein B0T16DRAFT_497807 [Cercophora newfieldiana]|uniref:NmrA-like domain-containing protein n=1 Tax=Cercophora newfieldiana TaxID=92897 RepID=A0AA40CIN8_9PEZI|nr:hypothetical protein B0T16DRAFT_497807 [Cercophora newfieldiana]